MEKRVGWVHAEADCRDAVINKSRLLWRATQDALEQALVDYRARCGEKYPMIVDDYSRSDGVFRMILRRRRDDSIATLSIAVEYALASRPVTAITATWSAPETFNVRLKEQRFTVSRCHDDGALRIDDKDDQPCPVEELARRTLEPMLFGNV